MPAEPGLRFLILIFFFSFSIKFINRPLLLVGRIVAGFFCALQELFLNFRIKHSRPEPSVLPMSGTQLYFLLLPLVGVPNGYDNRTWAPFFNSDIFLLSLNQIYKPVTSTCWKNCDRLLLCSPIIIFNFQN